MHKYYDLNLIKKKYGEKMAHLCLNLFSTILETEGLLYKIMISNFPPSRYLYDDITNNNLIKEFKNYIYSFITTPYEVVNTKKTPQELFNEKCYYLYECKSESDLYSYKKYYQPHEMLCTFKGHRLEEKYIFFAIKKDLNLIKRNNDPKREDDYGKSVLCIQFDKGEYNYVTIITRYNHTVKNPNATYENNLEKINIGLTHSFEQIYHFNIPNSGVRSFSIPGYIKAKDGKYYKYNYEIDNIYYCHNNIIIDNGIVIKSYTNKSRYLIFDYYILDLHTKKIFTYKKINDSFITCFNNINKIEIINNNDYKIVKFLTNDNLILIKLNNNNQIIEYYNQNIKEIPDNFMLYNKTLKKIELPNTQVVGNMFLPFNNTLTIIIIPHVLELGEYFLYDNNILEELITPELRILKISALKNNFQLKNIYAPNLTYISPKTFIESLTKLKIKFQLIALKNILIYKLKRDNNLSSIKIKHKINNNNY